MSDRKLAKAIQTLFRQVARLSRNMSRALIAWLLRTALVANRRTRPTAGFVLPTTVLLILVVSLTAGALSYRAFNTSTRTITETQNRVIYNAATPAIDRARAKMEFLFDANKDTRFPGGVPSTDYLASMLLNNNNTINGQKAAQLRLNGQDPYTLPDELAWGQANGFSTGRLDVNGDGTADNAWAFSADTDGDGKNDATVVYSIALSSPLDTGTGSNVLYGWQRLVGLSDADKAKGKAGAEQSPLPFSRTGPLSNSPSASKCKPTTSTGSSVDKGWYQDASNTSVLRKNFQVDAFVLPLSATLPGGANNFATLEFQQDRVLNRGNKWGAWFRNDLEVYPGPQFQWNGAMHTEGSLMLGGGNSFSAYLISAPASCLWYQSASEITVTDIKSTAASTDDYQGQMISGTMKDNDPNGGSALVYIWSQGGYSSVRMTSGNDSVQGSVTPYDVSIDPSVVQLRNGYQSRTGGTNRPPSTHNAAFDGSSLNSRIYNRPETAPYVDDTYRADDRYGPKQKYSAQVQIPAGKSAGNLILGTDNVSVDPTNQPLFASAALIPSDPTTGADVSSVGLDGYWERRARNQGLRVLVGQRLELGNTYGWVPPQDRPVAVVGEALEQTYLQTPAPALTTIAGVSVAPTIGDGDYLDQRARTGSAYATSLYTSSTDPNQIDPDISDNEGDPLYSPYSTITPLSHEARQRRTLRDNLAAVQSTAVYHGAVDKDYPVACMASVVHPGSPLTLQQSLNFVPTVFVDSTATNADPANNATPSTVDTALIADFFNGRGTNGWEFNSPGGDKATFLTDIANANSPLRIALNNLAQFAGDHVSDTQTGAFPPTQEVSQIHPDPEFSMWGNFSNLRRTLTRLDAVGYDSLSVADKTYLHTAACTLGMLAYNVDRVQRFNPTNFKNDIIRPGQGEGIVQSLGSALYKLMDGSVNEAAGDFEVLPKGRLRTYGYDPNGTFSASDYYERDYDRVPAEAYLGKLREYISASNPTINPNNDPRYRLAELIFTNFQIRRDRTYGFRPSPAANTWNYNPYAAAIKGKVNLWSSACDPNVFAFNDDIGKQTGKQGVIAYAAPLNTAKPFSLTQGANYNLSHFEADPTTYIYRVALSRLCGTVIPPGAVRDYPGDTGFPAREGSEASGAPTPTVTTNSPNKISSLNFIPRKDPDTFSQDTPLAKSPDAFAFKTGLPTLQTNLNKYDTFPYTATPSATATILNNNGYPYLTASVAPKWPSLYYLFPEVTHKHLGAVEDVGSFSTTGALPVGNGSDGIGTGNKRDNNGNGTLASPVVNWEDDVDHRQPTGQLAYPIASDASTFVGSLPPVVVSNILPAALQPWAEPYIVDQYIQSVNQTVTYKPVDTITPAIIPAGRDLGYIVDDVQPTLPGNQPVSFADLKDLSPPPASATPLTYQYKTFANPLADLSVAAIALKPRKLPTGFNNPFSISGSDYNTWQLPVSALPANPPTQNTPPNRITAPNGTAVIGTTAVIPFLDHALFNGREWQSVRVMDVDLGMLRRTRPGNQNAANTDSYAPNDAWLPVSGIVYAFREDAVREDAINRPPNAVKYTDLRNPAVLTDPALDASLVSQKAVDGVPDPDRRPYGFRLRNGTQLKRHTDLSIDPKDNIRGLSFFTDDPVYIMGYFNLHQKNNGEDVNDPTDSAIRLEEFVELLPSTGGYGEDDFYKNRTTINNDFADRDADLWRPAEILADGVSIISNTFCDGSVLDTFMTSGSGSGATIGSGTYNGRNKTDSGAAFPTGFFPYRVSAGNAGGASVYTTASSALYSPGCANNGVTSFLNQNRPSADFPGGTGGNWGWLRENPADIFSPIKVSRNGYGLGIQSQVNARAATTGEGLLKQKPLAPISYSSAPLNGTYYTAGDNKALQTAQATRVNTIMVSSIVPSRNGQAYGGLHNFPRFLENWQNGGVPLWFAGSFLQLSFSNYATAPFDQKATEPPPPSQASPAPGAETIKYYAPPARLWGYDVALQKSPAGPAAARFVTATKERNEFYQEPAVNDPYIRNLCIALPNALFPDSKCPS